MIGKTLLHFKGEGKRLVKYTAVFGAVGACGCAGVGKLVFNQLKDNAIGDVMRHFHENFPMIPVDFQPTFDLGLKKLLNYVANKHEKEVVGNLAFYGAMTGLSFGFSAGLFRVATGFIWNGIRLIFFRVKK
jgi:hypothetical protein